MSGFQQKKNNFSIFDNLVALQLLTEPVFSEKNSEINIKMKFGKFVAITVLVFLSVCFASEVNKSTWGKVTSCRLATRNVVVAGTRNQLTNYTLIYPEVN